jgi:hypothetical protein
MGLQIRSLAGSLLLAGALTLMPVHASSDGPGYQKAFANNAGGNGQGKGQGDTHAGSNGGASANAGANGGGSAASVGLLSASLGRFNSLKALPHAAPNSRIGMFAAEYSNALNAFADATVTDPTAEELAAILAKFGNKELTADAINWINEQFVNQGLVLQTTLDQASAILAPPIDPNADPNAVATVTPTFAELIAEQANLIQATQTSEGLGPIY